MDLNKSKSEKNMTRIRHSLRITWRSAEPGQWPTDALYGRRGDGRHPETPCSYCKVWKFSRGVVDEPLNQPRMMDWWGIWWCKTGWCNWCTPNWYEYCQKGESIPSDADDNALNEQCLHFDPAILFWRHFDSGTRPNHNVDDLVDVCKCMEKLGLKQHI